MGGGGAASFSGEGVRVVALWSVALVTTDSSTGTQSSSVWPFYANGGVGFNEKTWPD